jgi:hypothetical protein
MARATAATDLLSQALHAGDESLGAGAANEILEAVAALRASVRGLEAELGQLRARLDTLGPGTLAVEHIVAYWMSRNPANRDLGETPEIVEEQLVYEMNRTGSDNWNLLHEGPAKAPCPREEDPSRHLRTAFERKLVYWEPRTRSPEEVRVSPNKERRVRSFAILHRCKPGVALEALLDYALFAAGEPGVPASEAEEIKSTIRDTQSALADLRAQFEILAGDVGFVGELVAGLAPLLSLLCTQDGGIRHSALQGKLLRIEPEELYARLSAYVCTHAVWHWDGRVRSVTDAQVPEGAPVKEEWLRSRWKEGEGRGGGS